MKHDGDNCAEDLQTRKLTELQLKTTAGVQQLLQELNILLISIRCPGGLFISSKFGDGRVASAQIISSELS